MTANIIYNTACMLAGRDIYEEYIEENDNLKRQAVFIINQVLLELGIGIITSLEDNIKLLPKQAEALIYGAARLIATYSADSYKINELTEIYNNKRAAALCSISRIKNTIPT